jgi:hypothetical protein
MSSVDQPFDSQPPNTDPALTGAGTSADGAAPLEPVAAGHPSVRTKFLTPRLAPRISTPILAVALLVVGMVAGGGLFLSGYSLGRQAATTPGTPVTEDQAFQPFWDAYRAVTDRYAGGTVDRKALV